MSARITRTDTGESLTLHATTRFEPSRTSRVTSFPVEDGTERSDHAQLQSRRIGVQGEMTQALGGLAPIEAAIFLESVQRDAATCTLYSGRLGFFDNLILEELTQDGTGSQRIVFRMTWREIVIAQTRTVTLAARRQVVREDAQGLVGEEDAGPQGTDDASDATTERATSLARLLGLGSILGP